MEKELSQLIKNLRFPLAVLIVIGHSDMLHFPFLSGGGPVVFDSSFCSYPITYLCRVLFSPANALFFVLSGFLFFGLSDIFNKYVYSKKLAKRFRTLFIPYLLWQLIFFVPLVISSIKSGESYSPLFFIQSIWNVPGTPTPADPPLWFLRDLMVCMVLSPLFYIVLKRWWLAFPIFGFVFVSWFFDLNLFPNVNGFSPLSIIFFGIGSAVGIYKVKIVSFLKRYGAMGGGIFLLLSLADMLTKSYVPQIDGSVQVECIPYLNNAIMVLACVAYPYIILRCCTFFSKIDMGGTFAIYASHWGTLILINAVISRLCPPLISPYLAISLFLLRVVGGVLGGLIVNWILSKNNILSMLFLGGRI